MNYLAVHMDNVGAMDEALTLYQRAAEGRRCGPQPCTQQVMLRVATCGVHWKVESQINGLLWQHAD
eukprot:2008467-Amphidinium_carterae.1